MTRVERWREFEAAFPLDYAEEHLSVTEMGMYLRTVAHVYVGTHAPHALADRFKALTRTHADGIADWRLRNRAPHA